MREKAVYRLRDESGRVQWIHSSRLGNTVVLRFMRIADESEGAQWSARTFRFPNDQQQLEQVTAGAEQFSLAEIAARTEDVLDVSADRLRVDDVDKWSQIFHRLEDPGILDSPPAHKPPKVTDEVPRRSSMLIPQTRMRRFYETLRVFAIARIHKE